LGAGFVLAVDAFLRIAGSLFLFLSAGYAIDVWIEEGPQYRISHLLIAVAWFAAALALWATPATLPGSR
jgi:hypothetical protein